MGFYTFEEDLPNHIRQVLMLVGTGMITTFFDSPWVRDMTQGLNERHRPIYHSKMLKLLRCVTETLDEEIFLLGKEYVSSFMGNPLLHQHRISGRIIFGSCPSEVALPTSWPTHTASAMAFVSSFLMQPWLQQRQQISLSMVLRLWTGVKLSLALRISTAQRLVRILDIGLRIEDCHKAHGMEPDAIGSHTVDGRL